jgi:hypothetical protein
MCEAAFATALRRYGVGRQSHMTVMLTVIDNDVLIVSLKEL